MGQVLDWIYDNTAFLPLAIPLTAGVVLLYYMIQDNYLKWLRKLWLLPRSEKCDGPNGDPCYVNTRVHGVMDNNHDWMVHVQAEGRPLCLNISKRIAYKPQEGDRLRLYGSPHEIIHGLIVNDSVIFWHRPSAGSDEGFSQTATIPLAWRIRLSASPRGAP